MKFSFEPQNFINNLPYMGKGMLAIFIVIGIIVLITVLLSALTKNKEQ